MRKYTVYDKYDYNRKQKTPFGRGYCEGVDLYLEYRLDDDSFNRKVIRQMVDFESNCAKRGYADSKGFMCGFRDMADEFKKK